MNKKEHLDFAYKLPKKKSAPSPNHNTIDSLDIFQKAVGILVAEEIHDGGCNRADKKEEHQAF